MKTPQLLAEILGFPISTPHYKQMVNNDFAVLKKE